MSKFKKGDRVEFPHENQTIYGVISRGGTKPKIIEDGGMVEYGVPLHLIKLSDKPLRKGPEHPMDKWKITKYKENPSFSEETICFKAEITKNGKRVIAAENNGTGGCNSYYPLTGGYEIVREFEEASKQWLLDHGKPEERCFEPSDDWINWKVNQEPYGVTANDYVEKSIERWNEFSSMKP